MVVKTYRGQLADDGQDRIRLRTIKGKVGYRIAKFEVISTTPTASVESVLQIWRALQTSAVATIDFASSTLLGVGMWTSSADAYSKSEGMVIIFDSEIFNQDIFITHKLTHGSGASCNYYLELEVIPLASDEAAITTVKAMRGTAVD